MGFKTDASFLQFLTMGALGVRQTMKQLAGMGFKPIELERYCASNKIWTTKVKRLRLPDLLCVQTGLRLEVRAKSDLKIRMSDAPNNPERRWDAGLRGDDVAAFIAIRDIGTGPLPAEEAVFFSVKTLRDSAALSTLGPPKSASEGAERDRTWPAIIPSCDGVIESVSQDKLVVTMQTGETTARKQTYTLKGKKVYLRPGNHFKAAVSILAGAPENLADLSSFLGKTYDPLAALQAENAVDRYAAVKSIPYRDDLRAYAIPPLEILLKTEKDERVALEAAATSAVLGSNLGQEQITKVLWGEGPQDLRMESILILTELKTPFAHTELKRVAAEQKFVDDEVRQAAVWGLGKAGLKAYEDILPYIDDQNEDVAMHAIVSFGADTPGPIIRRLVEDLIKGNERRASAASETLRLISNETVLKVLIEAAESDHDWAVATLGRLPINLVKPALTKSDLLKKITPMLLLSTGANWLASEDLVIEIGFLTKQNL